MLVLCDIKHRLGTYRTHIAHTQPHIIRRQFPTFISLNVLNFIRILFDLARVIFFFFWSSTYKLRVLPRCQIDFFRQLIETSNQSWPTFCLSFVPFFIRFLFVIRSQMLFIVIISTNFVYAIARTFFDSSRLTLIAASFWPEGGRWKKKLSFSLWKSIEVIYYNLNIALLPIKKQSTPNAVRQCSKYTAVRHINWLVFFFKAS